VNVCRGGCGGLDDLATSRRLGTARRQDDGLDIVEAPNPVARSSWTHRDTACVGIARLRGEGTAIETISKLLGHASPTITRTIYIGVIDEKKRETASLLDDLFVSDAR
jgi:integrase